jgi:hypothetical protein
MEMLWMLAYINQVGMMVWFFGGEREVDGPVFEANKQNLALESRRICVEGLGMFGQA